MRINKQRAGQALTLLLALGLALGMLAGYNIEAKAATSTLGSIPVGEIVYLNEDGVKTPFIVAEHNYYGSGRTALLREKIKEFQQWSSTGGINYVGSNIENYMAAYLNRLDTTVQREIAEIKIRDWTQGWEDRMNCIHGVRQEIYRKIFPPSLGEIGLETGGTSLSGSKLEYFSLKWGNSIAYNQSGSPAWYWTRNGDHYYKSHKDNEGDVIVDANRWTAFVIDNTGNFDDGGRSSDIHGMRPMFTLSPSINVDENNGIGLNTAPTISGADGGLGDKGGAFSVPYQVNDSDKDTLTVTETLNGSTLRTFTAAAGSSLSLSVSAAQLQALPAGSTNTLTMIANDNKGGVATRTHTFVAVDTVSPTAPGIAKSPAATWHNGNVTVSITHGTDGHSGVLHSEYSFNNASWNTYSAPFAVTASQSVYARTVDRSGNISPVSSIAVNIDKTSPTAPGFAKNPTADWHSGDVTVTITHGSDGQSGVSRSEYSLNNVNWSSYTGPLTITARQTVYARTFDRAGNVSDTSSFLVQIDRVSPNMPRLTINSQSEWQKGGSSVALSLEHGSDADSGVNRSEISFNNSDWQQYYTPLTITDDATVYARTIDKAGNLSSVSSKQVKFDWTAPAEPQITRTPDVAYSNKDVTVTVATGTDTQSGIDRTEYALGLDDKKLEWQEYTAPFVLSESSNVYLRTFDRVGNAVNVQELIRIDKEPPRVSEIAIKSIEGERYVTVTGEDGTGISASGVKEIHVNEKVFSGSSATYLPLAADKVAKIQIFDVAGNQSQVEERDVVPPEIVSLTVNKSFTAADIVARDADGSGVRGIYVDGQFFAGERVTYPFDPDAPPYYLDVQAEDNDKNRSQVTRYDVYAPTITDLQVSGDFRTAVIHAQDKGGSGVKGIYVDDAYFEGNPIVYEIPPATEKLTVYAEDNAGNKGAYQAQEFKIQSPDKNPPEILSVTIDSTYTKVKIIAEDDFSGIKGVHVNKAFYNGNPVTVELLSPNEGINEKPATEPSKPGPTIGESGELPALRKFRAPTIGESGNLIKPGLPDDSLEAEPPKKQPKAPVISRTENSPPVMLSLQAEDYAGNLSEVYVQDVKRPIISNLKISDDHTSLTVTAYDEGGSEVKYIYIDGQAYTENPVTYQLQAGTTVLKIYTEDGAGNTSDIVDLDVTQKDRIPPAIESVKFKENGTIAEITASDEGGSGLKGIFVNGKLFGGGRLSYEIPDRTKNLLIQAIDYEGNLSKSLNLDINEPDRIPPVIDSITLNEKGTAADIAASDTGSGVKGILVDGTLFPGGKITYPIPNGTTKILVQAVDNVGNKSAEIAKDIPKPEPTPPPVASSIKITITPPEDFKNSRAKIKIAAHDKNYDIVLLEAKIDGGDWEDITDDPYVELTENGAIYVQAENSKGDTQKKSANINCFDKDAPRITATQEGGTLKLAASDALSGVNAIYVNDRAVCLGEKSTFTQGSTLSFDYTLSQDEAPGSLTVHAVDNAGNRSKELETKVKAFAASSEAAKPTPSPSPKPTPSSKPAPADTPSGEKSNELVVLSDEMPPLSPGAQQTDDSTASRPMLTPTLPTPKDIKDGKEAAYLANMAAAGYPLLPYYQAPAAQNQPYIITIEQPPAVAAPNVNGQDNSSTTLLVVVICVLFAVLIALGAFAVAAFVFNNNSSDAHRLRFMLEEIIERDD